MRDSVEWLLSLPLLLVFAAGCRDQPPRVAASVGVATTVSPHLGTFESDVKSASGSRWHAIDDSAAGGASKAKVERVAGGAAGTEMALHVVASSTA